MSLDNNNNIIKQLIFINNLLCQNLFLNEIIPLVNFNSNAVLSLMNSKDEKKLLSVLNLTPIPPDEVMLKPELIKR